MLAAIILAGGESRRMGSVKALLPFHNQTFVEHLVEVTRHPRIGAQRVVVGAHAEQIRAQVALDPKIIVENADWRAGQLSSLQAGIRSLREIETEGLMLCLVDHPLISSGVVDSLVRAFDRSGMPIAVPTFRSKRGHPIIFSSKLYDELLEAPLDKGARIVVWNHPNEICEMPTDEEGVVMNLNDPESFRHTAQPQP